MMRAVRVTGSTADRLRACLWLRAPLLLLAAAAGGCVYLPDIVRPGPSHVLPPDPTGRVAHLLGNQADSTVRGAMVADAHQALTARLDLVDAAETSIDLQYFIWHNDATGLLMIDRLLAAADRGVRVRALLDDVQLEGLVNKLTALDRHPNIEIRIFNPFSLRWRYRFGMLRLIEFALDGNRLNHRMHNKLLVADGQAAIIGGRNIGDDYFGRSNERNFVDLDLLLSGPVVPALAQGFDTYWNSRWSYPVNRLLNVSILPEDLSRLRQRIRARLAERPALLAQVEARSADGAFATLREGAVITQWQVFVDEPRVRWFERPDDLAVQLTDIALTAERRVLIVSPYLVPGARLLRLGEELAERGVHLAALTNSLQTNDVVIAQAAFSNRRAAILASGVELYEFRGDAQVPERDTARDISLHSKFILFDDDNVFLGSLNLDPRSLYLNTELGVYLQSPQLTAQLRAYFRRLIHPDNAWRVTRQGDEVVWTSSAGVQTRPPAKSFWQRLRHQLLRLLPLGGQV